MARSRTCVAVAVAATATLALTACGGAGSTSGGEGNSKSLEVFSWWTSGSESEALQVLQGAFTTADSGVAFKNSAVSGGGGSNARTALATRLQGGNPPDSWQLHPDQDLMSVVQDGSVADLTSLFKANGWEAKLPDAVKAMLQKDGKYYAVPVNAHRANVLWTSPAVLKKAGVTLTENTTLVEFMSDLPKLKATGAAPICLGGKDPFAPAQLLESVILANVGADGYKQLMTGALAFDDAKVRTAVTQFGELLKNTNDDSAVLTWDQAAVNTSEGKCAATLMGDWAFGELGAKGKKDGTDFSHVAFPGTGQVYDFVGDAFVIPAKNAPNPDAEKVWLTQLLDSKVQSEFNLKKGSAPVTSDASLGGGHRCLGRSSLICGPAGGPARSRLRRAAARPGGREHHRSGWSCWGAPSYAALDRPHVWAALDCVLLDQVFDGPFSHPVVPSQGPRTNTLPVCGEDVLLLQLGQLVCLDNGTTRFVVVRDGCQRPACRRWRSDPRSPTAA